MKKYLLFVGLFLISYTNVQAQAGRDVDPDCNLTDADIKHPPVKFTRATIDQWIDEAIQKIRPGMKYKIMDTAEWANYINCNHFVPPGSDPHAGGKVGEVINFDWSEDTYKSKGLPTAEVIETGEFYFWWNRCNFKKFDEKTCKGLIDIIVKHESRHYDQWKNIALETLNSLNISLKKTVDGKSVTSFPETSKDLEAIAGAYKKFMSVWADQAHYQCREVEDYSLNILTGEMPSAFFDERIPYMMWYTKKCEASKWSTSFYPHILRANSIEKWWKLGNTQTK